MRALRTAVYSTVFPGVEPYLQDWYRALRAQEDRDFDLWIGVDSPLTRDRIEDAAKCRVEANLVFAEIVDTPASLRRKCLQRVVSSYDIVVLIDSDDLPLPARVARAKRDTRRDSLSACALTLVDESGMDLGVKMDVDEGADWSAILPARNILGLSNTAYGADLLERLLDFRDDCELLDWHLAVRSWLAGARIHFEHEPLMRYRQYSRNIATVLPPFTADQVLRATMLVRRHFDRLPWEADIGSDAQWALLRDARRRVDVFATWIADETRLNRYVHSLNRLGAPFLWWDCVANLALEGEWTTLK